ncbi:hypothetical protein C789_5453 [Microcystis aeruginosa FACHB-905 = DIANCHI905]|uniref:Uncharacterized protein n=1 Tax=Microcystis aeruginosa PCC 7806SL TaxID=1903187 RepID=A0AB33BFZ5_MICA7|nr:hypothetical protein BH695_0501 [Microcystis aeruginosa PCC 7806SL]ELS44747.1 hypothetical protein C789_5453 [Microcystis aeruginosa FACHB-905 = DIANCHI905]
MATITSNIEKPDSEDGSFNDIPFPLDFTFQTPVFPENYWLFYISTTEYANDRIFLTLVRELIPRKPYLSSGSDCLSSWLQLN